jgi:hypothetical protein
LGAGTIIRYVDKHNGDVKKPLTPTDGAPIASELTAAIIFGVGALVALIIFLYRPKRDPLPTGPRKSAKEPPQTYRRKRSVNDQLGSPPTSGTAVNKHKFHTNDYLLHEGNRNKHYHSTGAVGDTLDAIAVAAVLNDVHKPIPRETPTESFGFTSNNEDARGFMGGGADVDVTPTDSGFGITMPSFELPSFDLPSIELPSIDIDFNLD